jgi:hypothetical protein
MRARDKNVAIISREKGKTGKRQRQKEKEAIL